MKKLLAILLTVMLICGMLAGCTQTNEDAIKSVITSYYQAGFLWDYGLLQACVAPEVPVYDPYVTNRNTYLQKAQQGFMVEEDIDSFMELDREFDQKLGEAIRYQNWDISVSGDTATVLLTVTGSGVNFDKLLTEDGEFAYRDTLFSEFCGMDEATAKASLSPEEFSSVHLKVQKSEYALWLENISETTEKVEIQLRKIAGQWKIVYFLPAE